jgi:hypothetical protein
MNQSKNSRLLTWFFSSDFLRDATNWTSFFQSTKEPTDATTKTATKIANPSIQAVKIVIKFSRGRSALRNALD